VPVTPERWQHIARIYELAVDQDPSTRDTFLCDACAGDEALRRDVESLLREDDASVVLDRSVWTLAAPLFDEHLQLAIGTLLGPYRIEGALGAGGMGEVFTATDTRLNRRVAIKVLPRAVALDEQMRARFAREARAVAALTHPHICTLYDVGRHEDVDFLVMEHLEGETLATRLTRGQLPLDVSLTYATEIAAALDHAHRQGIVHRDLKPANIMLTASGAKLLDFGVAKLRTASGETANADVTNVGTTPNPTVLTSANSNDVVDVAATCRGAILGTLRYMAPEQITGRAVDARSDLFSFGTVLYEMLTGKRAFEGDSAASIRAAVLEREPPAVSSLEPSVPRSLDELIGRCLAKNPDERWQTADEMLHALKRVGESSARPRTRTREMLRWIAAILITGTAALGGWLWIGGVQRSSSPAKNIRAIAVLPLNDLSGQTDEDYFADGMTEQLIADLASIGELRVISRMSVMNYKKASKPVSSIAKELNVDALIEGAIVRANDRVRITAKLVDGASGTVLWAQSFERDLRDVLGLQREVARAITSKVNVTLTPQEQALLATGRVVAPEVHRNVLLGRHHTSKSTEEGLRKAVQYFDLAIDKDPANAMAHSGLAEAYVGLSGFYLPPRDAMPKAKRAAETAIALDESLADAHAALGFVHLVYDWDGPAAEKSLARALELNPTLATARLHRAAYLTTQARHDEAVQEIRRAVEFDPVSIRTNAVATSLLLFTERYDEAIELARRGLEFEPNNALALAFQGVAYVHLGRYAEAVSNVKKAEQLDQSATILSLEALVLAVAGLKDGAKQVVRRVEEIANKQYFCPYEVGAAYVSLGDADAAYRWFRRGLDERADCMAWLGVEPWIEPFRSDPRYATLLREIGLDPRSR
jgi:eukaryotic-like serine/threonine-protein kinase